jgi:hypothetical protein
LPPYGKAKKQEVQAFYPNFLLVLLSVLPRLLNGQPFVLKVHLFFLNARLFRQGEGLAGVGLGEMLYICKKVELRIMETVSVKIRNPKARQLLNDLVELELIDISPRVSFVELLPKLRNNERQAPTLEEITAEVEIVRAARYAKQA